MPGALLLSLFCQLAGETVAHASGLPRPWPALGMALLCGLLAARVVAAEGDAG
jgi:putative effector of murein hydrolase LrgA (UPF0299 family)